MHKTLCHHFPVCCQIHPCTSGGWHVQMTFLTHWFSGRFNGVLWWEIKDRKRREVRVTPHTLQWHPHPVTSAAQAHSSAEPCSSTFSHHRSYREPETCLTSVGSAPARCSWLLDPGDIITSPRSLLPAVSGLPNWFLITSSVPLFTSFE